MPEPKSHSLFPGGNAELANLLTMDSNLSVSAVEIFVRLATYVDAVGNYLDKNCFEATRDAIHREYCRLVELAIEQEPYNQPCVAYTSDVGQFIEKEYSNNGVSKDKD